MLKGCLQYFTLELVHILMLKDVILSAWEKKETLIVKNKN